jgi:hypothetical protein
VPIVTMSGPVLVCLALNSVRWWRRRHDRRGEAQTRPSRAAKTKTFEGDGYSFTYPGDWDEQKPDLGTEVGTATSSTRIGLNTTNFLGVVAVGLPASASVAEITDATLASARELIEKNGGQVTAGPIPITIGGLLGFRYEGWLITEEGVRVQSRLTWAVDDTHQYFMNCQFTPEHAEEMKRGCDQVEKSFTAE